VTLADQVERGQISERDAREAVRIARELGNLPEGSSLADTQVLGESVRAKSGPQAVYEFINNRGRGICGDLHQARA